MNAMPETVSHAPALIRPALIRMSGVGLSFGPHVVLQDIDLAVAQGEFLCIVGASGCGKTTLLRMIAGLQAPGRGTITIGDRQVREPSRDVAVVFQDYGRALLPWRDAAGNVSLALEAMGIAASERTDRVHALLARVGLARHASAHPHRMSGGMQQRLQIARCLAQEPAVLLMDEPFGALDAMTRQSLQDTVLSIVAAGRTTVFFVTHDLEEAAYLGDRVVGLRPNPGRVGVSFDVRLKRPRDQLSTREDPEFLRLRRALFAFIQANEA